jgi:hypothetical protein
VGVMLVTAPSVTENVPHSSGVHFVFVMVIYCVLHLYLLVNQSVDTASNTHNQKCVQYISLGHAHTEFYF